MNGESLEVLTHKLESLHADVGEIKIGLDKLSSAVVQLALVEERLATSQASLGRAFTAIEKNASSIEKLADRIAATQAAVERALTAIEKQATAQAALHERIERLERAEPKSTAMANRIENALWASGAVVAVVVLKKSGLM